TSQKVHPQPMKEAMNQNPEVVETLVSKIFTNISTLKSTYIQLQGAHTPYDPDKIHTADKFVINSCLAAEIQEQQSLLKRYEVMVNKFQSEIHNKDLEIHQLEKQIEDAKDGNGFFPVDLTPNLFTTSMEADAKAIHDFSKPLINMMKAVGWYLNVVANSIKPNDKPASRELVQSPDNIKHPALDSFRSQFARVVQTIPNKNIITTEI
ncbi:hypothetical protein RYX36_026343, partial [Vicia faba]